MVTLRRERNQGTLCVAYFTLQDVIAMRIHGLSDVTVAGVGSHTIYLAGNKGEQFQFSVLDHDLFRVQMRPEGTYRLDRTWSVMSMISGDSHREKGVNGQISHNFPVLNGQWSRRKDHITVRTKALQMTMKLNELMLSWQTLEDEKTFASDASVCAYAHNPSGRDIYHHMQYVEGDCYYGFGEKAGELNKDLMRLEMRNLDAIGYRLPGSVTLSISTGHFISHSILKQILLTVFFTIISRRQFLIWLGNVMRCTARIDNIMHWMVILIITSSMDQLLPMWSQKLSRLNREDAFASALVTRLSRFDDDLHRNARCTGTTPLIY